MTSTQPVPFTVVAPWLPSSSWSLRHCRDVVWWIGPLFLEWFGFGLGFLSVFCFFLVWLQAVCSVNHCTYSMCTYYTSCVLWYVLVGLSVIVTCVMCYWQSAHVIPSTSQQFTHHAIPSIYPYSSHTSLHHPSSSPYNLLARSFSLFVFSNSLPANLPLIFFFSLHLSLILSRTLGHSVHPELWVWERKRGREWAWGKAAEEGGEEGEAHSCGWLIESQQFGQRSPDVWEWSGICSSWLCLCRWTRGSVRVRGREDWQIALFLVTVREWVSETFSFLSECVFVLLLFSTVVLTLLSLLSATFTVCPTSFCVGCCLFTKKTI